MNLAVRVEAGHDIGLGHLMRVRSIVEAMEAKEARETIETKEAQEPLHVTFVTRSEFFSEHLLQIPPGVSENCEGEWIADNLPDTEVLLADLYQPTAGQLASLRSQDWYLACIDDDTPVRFDCDLLINPNLNTEFTHNRTLATPYLRGGNVIPLREQFQNPLPRSCREEVEHLLLAFGGSDPMQLTWRVCDWLRDRLPESIWRITVLVGSAYRDTNALRARLADDSRWRVQRNVSNVRSLLETADVGILAAGGTLYEAATTGLPTLSIAVNTAQEREAQTLAQANATHYLGNCAGLTTQAVLHGLDSLLEESVRQKMATNAQAMLDGGGSQRIAEAIENLVTFQEELRCAA